jgi:N6-L-threonylcarbamoyladenine synthase
MKTLAIETSCDDTSLGIVELKNGRFEPVKVLLHSQIDKHRKFGGVVPELASRLHEEKIMDLLEEIGLEEIKNVDFISYTCCPGLPGSLLVGTTLANTLSKFLNKEKVPVHHIQGHIFSIFVERNIDEIKFPLIVLTVSGGHNELYLVLRSEETFEVGRDF